MRWTSANIKNPQYTSNHELFVGTHTGSFKKIHSSDEAQPFTQENLCEISKLDKNSRITTLTFTDESKSLILIGRQTKVIQTYSLTAENLLTNVELMEPSVVGLCVYGNKTVAGFSSGKMQVLSPTENSSTVLVAGDNMSHMRQCAVERKLVATGGKDRQNNLKIFDLDAGKQIFSSKNLPNDFLQLEVPIWDSDVGFMDVNLVATCSRYGYVRLYDTRAQRRPIQKYATEDQMSFTTLVAKDHYIYTGTTMGALKAFDTRHMKNFVHTYKGFTGSITDLDLDETGKFLGSACLDRYVRVHHTDSCVLMYQCYAKSQATTILIREIEGKSSSHESTDLETSDTEEQQVGFNQEKDVEYEEMFSNMPTVCDETNDTENTKISPSAGKRKSSSETGKNGKKKKRK